MKRPPNWWSKIGKDRIIRRTLGKDEVLRAKAPTHGLVGWDKHLMDHLPPDVRAIIVTLPSGRSYFVDMETFWRQAFPDVLNEEDGEQYFLQVWLLRKP